MIEQDIINVFIWWLMLFCIGLISFPLTSLIFSNFMDKGYLFAKTIGILVISYSVYILGMTKLLKFTNSTIILVCFLLFVINLFVYAKYKPISAIIKNIKIIIAEEIIFFIALFFWSYVKAHEPSIHNLEKFMDFGFINSILRSDYFPPVDMWFPPFSINYYYFGHFITALLTKLSQIPPYVSFNIMIATLFSFGFSLPFSIVVNILYLKRMPRLIVFFGGILSGSLVALSGNLHTIYTLFLPYVPENPQPFWTLIFNPSGIPNSYWYANATRFIPFTIHEFPIYSFVVSDLHGHVIDIPFVLLAIALILRIFLSKNIKKIYIFFLSFILSVLYMTNAWDGIIYTMLSIISILFVNLRNLNILYSDKTKRRFIFFNTKIKKILNKEEFLYQAIKSILILMFGFILFSLPFSLNFKPFVSGIGVICSPDFLIGIKRLGPFLFEADHCQRSYIWQLFILYGFFYFFILSFTIFLIKRGKEKVDRSDLFVLVLICISTFLIITPEFIYAKDIYPAHYRANTMFKLVYQSFIMLSMASSYIIIIIIKSSKNLVFTIITLLLLFGVLAYPHFAINSYFNELKVYKGLNGINYLKEIHPTDFAAIEWINKNIQGQPVLLEAQGDSYTDYERISANTGLPTILGWTVHEWLWRGTYDITIPRIEDVKKIYETDLVSTSYLLKKYNVSYIYIGDLEREKYPNLDEQKFSQLGKIVYKNEGVKIYKIN